MSKIKVTVTFEDMIDVVVVFNEDEETYKLCHEINDFWSNKEDRLDSAQGCIYKCVTKMIAQEIFRLQMKSSFYCGTNAAIKAFKEGIEGYPQLDGSQGIELHYCDDFAFSDLNIDFKRETIEE